MLVTVGPSPSQVVPLPPRLWDTKFEERWWRQNAGLDEWTCVLGLINKYCIYRKHTIYTIYYSEMNGIAFNSNKILKRSFRNISKHSSKTTCQCQFCKTLCRFVSNMQFLVKGLFSNHVPSCLWSSGFSEGLYGDPGVWAPGKVGIELASEGQGKVKGVENRSTQWKR